MAWVSTCDLALASCIRSAPSQLVETRSEFDDDDDDDDDDNNAGRYWREVIPSFGGDGSEIASGRGCAAMVMLVGCCVEIFKEYGAPFG